MTEISPLALASDLAKHRAALASDPAFAECCRLWNEQAAHRARAAAFRTQAAGADDCAQAVVAALLRADAKVRPEHYHLRWWTHLAHVHAPGRKEAS